MIHTVRIQPVLAEFQHFTMAPGMTSVVLASLLVLAAGQMDVIYDDGPCPDGTLPVDCFANPCEVSYCSSSHVARCVPDYCGGCRARYYDRYGNQVECVEDDEYDCDTACPEIYSPVCGSDRVTYANGCELERAANCEKRGYGLEIMRNGECNGNEPCTLIIDCGPDSPKVCASDGNTYINECKLDQAIICGDAPPETRYVHRGECGWRMRCAIVVSIVGFIILVAIISSTVWCICKVRARNVRRKALAMEITKASKENIYDKGFEAPPPYSEKEPPAV